MYFRSLSLLLDQLKKDRQNKTLVFTNGCFDLLHIGHIRYLRSAKNCGDLLVVAVNSDQSVRQLKGPNRPLQKEEDRAEILSALSFVDYSFVFDDKTPLSVIKKIKPDVLVKGGDWKLQQIVGSDFVLSYQGKIKSLDFVEDHSTTGLIEKIANRLTKIN